MKYYLAILLSLLVVLAACAPATTPGETAPAETAPAETMEEESTMEESMEGPTARVEINRREFVPQELTVKVGTTVTWINNDKIGHTVQFYGNSKLGGIVPQGKTHEVVFTEAGEYEYINAAIGVKGKVIVEE